MGTGFPVPITLCTDGVDQLLFLFDGAVQLLDLGNDGICVSLCDTLFQFLGVRGIMQHDVKSQYSLLHRSTSLFRRVCFSFVHHAGSPPIDCTQEGRLEQWLTQALRIADFLV